MSTESGFDNQRKIGDAQFKTIQSIGSDQYGAHSVEKGLFAVAVAAPIVDSDIDDENPNLINIEITTHLARKGDVLVIRTGELSSWEFPIVNILTVNILQVRNIGMKDDGTTSAFPIAGNSVQVMRWVTPQFTSTGAGTSIITGGATEAKQDAQIVLETALNAAVSTSANQAAAAVLTGAVTETAPASDTASSGLNGRLQRIAQRITSLIALVPASLGQKSSALGFAVTLSTEQEGLIGSLTSTAPASDTASASLNGRLQRVAQRLTSLIAQFPTTIGQKASAASLGVALSTEQEALIGALTETAPATDTASSGLNGRLQRIAQRLTSLFPTTIGQKASAASLAVVLSTEQEALLGALTETAPATDTASAGHNGRLQRIAQRITSLIALVPASLGQKASAASFAVVLSTEQEGLLGALTETAPVTDTASAGHNGRLQRIAQRLTSLIALLPASLGQKASAASLAVTLSTEQEGLLGALTETAPASDTASAGHNGRLQRIAQRLTSLIALLPASLGQKTMAASLAVTLASDQGNLAIQAASVAGTVTTAHITVGTSAVRATVAGTAPSATRKKLMIKPNKNNTGAIYLGASGVTTANGFEIIGPDRLEFEFDAGDYFLISDTAAQSVDILEKV